MQTINYKEFENSISVGFKKYNFVVYGEMGKIENYTRNQYIQKLYEQCKNSIDYETERYNRGLKNSITTTEEGEEFIPEETRLKMLELLVSENYIQLEEGQENIDIYLSTIIKDQYNEEIAVAVDIISTLGEITDNILTIPIVEGYTEVIVTATIGEIIDRKIINVYPYIKPQEPEPNKIELLENKIAELETTIDIILGGEIIE